MNTSPGHRLLCTLALFVALVLPWSPLSADTETELRISIGLKLFPSMLAADERLVDKKNDKGNLHILVVYQDQLGAAEAIARRLTSIPSIKGIPLHITVQAAATIGLNSESGTGGIFLADALGDELAGVIAFAEKNRVLLFSPFVGDVERGVHGGISVRDRILPYINPKSLEQADIQLKPFFIKVSERHE